MTAVAIILLVMLLIVGVLLITERLVWVSKKSAVTGKPNTFMTETHDLVWLKIAGDYNLWHYKCSCGVVGKTNTGYITHGGTESQTFRAFQEHKEAREKMQLALTPPPPPSKLQLESDQWIRDFHAVEQSARKSITKN